MRDYRSHLLGNLKRKPATINNALAAIDDFCTRLGLGPANAARLDLPDRAPKSLDKRATLRWLRAVQAHPSTRDRVLAQLPFYAGIRIIETVRLDLDDIQLSARKGTLRVLGKGDKIREIPIHSAAPNWTSGSTNAQTGPKRPETPPCYSTIAAAASPPAEPAASSARSPTMPAWTTKPPPHPSTHLRHHPHPRRHRPRHRR